jgi:hypothetical protein
VVCETVRGEYSTHCFSQGGSGYRGVKEIQRAEGVMHS